MMNRLSWNRLFLLVPLLLMIHARAGAPPLASKTESSVWMDGRGTGYRSGAQLLDFKVIRGFGATNLNGNLKHDLLLGEIEYGYCVDDVWWPDSWYGGNLFATAGVMAGAQTSPDDAYLAFFNAGMRYEFATQGRIVPYLRLAIGIGATDIGAPDLTGLFQFAPQAGVGMRYYFSDDWSATLGFDYSHISNGGTRKPNSGLTSYMLSLGVGRAF